MSSTGRFLAASPALWHLRKLLLHPVGYRCTDTSSPTGGLSHGRALLPCLFLPWAPSLSPRGRGCTLHLLFLYYEEFSFPLLEVNRLLLVNNFTLNFPSPNNQCGFCFLTGPWLIQNPFKNRSSFSLGSIWLQLWIPSAAWPCFWLGFGPCSLVLTQRPHITLCLHFPPGAVNQFEWFSPTLRVPHLCLSRKSDESCSRSPNDMICLQGCVTRRSRKYRLILHCCLKRRNWNSSWNHPVAALTNTS